MKKIVKNMTSAIVIIIALGIIIKCGPSIKYTHQCTHC